MAELLVEAGGKLAPDGADSTRAKQLISQVLARRFFRTAGAMVAAEIGAVTTDVLKDRCPPDVIEWVLQKIAFQEACTGNTPGSVLFLQRAVENRMVTLSLAL